MVIVSSNFNTSTQNRYKVHKQYLKRIVVDFKLINAKIHIDLRINLGSKLCDRQNLI